MKTSSDQQPPIETNISRRFLFDNADIRGETVHVGGVFEEILALHRYPPVVNQLLGEFLAAAVLLSTTLKFEGKLILQARSSGQIPLIMVECTNQLQVRAIVRGAEQASSSDFSQLLHGGQLAITIDPRDGQRYQSIVPLAETSLAESLDAYFDQSEQLATRFWLQADQHQAAGMLLQQLPTQTVADNAQREEQWQHVRALANTIKAGELLTLQTPELLHRLYHETPVRLFEPSAVKFQCSCSRDRTLDALATIDRAELEDILKEQGEITMDCEFCSRQYRYNEQDIAPLLAAKASAGESRTLH